MPDLLSPRDAGHLLGLTTSGVIKLARRSKLPEQRDSSGRRFFLRADVERAVVERAVAARARLGKTSPRDTHMIPGVKHFIDAVIVPTLRDKFIAQAPDAIQSALPGSRATDS